MSEERKFVVWESRKRKTRFMTVDDGSKHEDTDHHIVIAENCCDEDAKILCKQREENNINSFLGDLPESLRNPEMDVMIANMIRNG